MATQRASVRIVHAVKTSLIFWRHRKHPAQIQGRLQRDGGRLDISGLMYRTVEHVNCEPPTMLVALFGRQFTKHSDCIPNGRDTAVPAHQLECQFRGANQSISLSGAA
jgi:hypothetical protein